MAVTMRQVSVALNLLSVAGRTDDMADVGATLQENWPLPLAHGTGDGQVNQVYWDAFTIAGGATLSVDLAGVLTNPFGETITFTAIKMVAVRNTTASTNSILSVGAAGSTVLTAVWTGLIAPQCFFFWSSRLSGEGVVAATGDVLTIINTDATNTASGRVVILGVE